MTLSLNECYFCMFMTSNGRFIERIKKLKESLDSFGDPAEDIEDKILRFVVFKD